MSNIFNLSRFKWLQIGCLIGFFLFLSDKAVIAATIKTEGSEIIISGILTAEDFEQVKLIFDNNKKIKTVIFDNCMGGTVDAGYKISQLIRTSHLSTVAKHQCHSSCAYAFLAGVDRKFDSGIGMHSMLLHLSRNSNPSNDVASIVNPALMRYISFLTGNKITPLVKNLIEVSTQQAQGVIFIQNNYGFFKTQKTVYCNGSEEGNLDKCKFLQNSDAKDLGIITER